MYFHVPNGPQWFLMVPSGLQCSLMVPYGPQWFSNGPPMISNGPPIVPNGPPMVPNYPPMVPSCPTMVPFTIDNFNRVILFMYPLSFLDLVLIFLDFMSKLVWLLFGLIFT